MATQLLHADALGVLLVIAAVSCGGSARPEDADQTGIPASGPAAGPVQPASAAEVPVPSPTPWVDAGLEALQVGERLGWPVQSVHITSTFGWRVDPVSGVGVRLHRGVDFRGKIGDLVLTVGDGTVSFAGHDPLLGNLVIVAHDGGVTSMYGHLSDLLVSEGVKVDRGAAVGLVGNTGRSAAPHLHLTMKLRDTPVDPLLLLGQPLHQPEAWVATRPEAPEPAQPGPAPETPSAAAQDESASTQGRITTPETAPAAPAVIQP